LTASKWLEHLANCPNGLLPVYGNDAAVLQGSLRLWRETLRRFLERFGDREIRLFRSPGRINLRGMHVDTHGGFLNLMTHQREIVVVASTSNEPFTTAINIDPVFPEASFCIRELSERCGLGAPWRQVIASPWVRNRVQKTAGSWQNYVEGCALNVQHTLGSYRLPELCLAVGGNLPQGAALSSSAALCASMVLAFSRWAGKVLSPEELILAARDGEWYAGSRCGVSDQAAIVLGTPSRCVNIALRPERLDISSKRLYELPQDVAVLVADSQTQRSLSGKQLIDYTRNRFVYSMALHVCRHELAVLGMRSESVKTIDRLPALSPGALEAYGGLELLYRVLLQIPETIELAALRSRYDIPDVDALYAQYFGNVPESERPGLFHMRGPLLFGIAESERARVFPDAVGSGDWPRTGDLMRIGHDGDRRLRADGRPYVFDTSDGAIARLARDRIPIENCPGVYGASTPALDKLVDAAIDAGAYGACLTGAGLAGSALALCPRTEAEEVAEKLRRTIASPEYAALAGVAAAIPAARVGESVVVNHPVAGAGEVRL